MNTRLLLARMLLLIFGLLVPCHVQAQSDEGEVSLGDLARTMRNNKQVQQKPVIDNDNFSEIMDAAEKLTPSQSFKYSINSSSNSFNITSPDATCSLSFNARATALISNPFSTRSLPDAELAKLNGPARIEGNTLELSVYNGTGWSLREITVGVTIVRSPSSTVI